jgi:hypothetical protein
MGVAGAMDGARFTPMASPSGMVYVSRTPSPPLDAFIDTLWWLSDAPAHTHELIPPSGTLELVVNLHENELRIYGGPAAVEPKHFSGAIVSGAYSAPFVIDTREHASIVGVHFKPGGALPFIGAPPGEVGSAHVDLEAIWGGAARDLRARLLEAATPAQRFRILERSLLARLRRPFKRHAAVPAALAQLAQPRASIGQVTEQLGLSRRRLIEVFTAEVGTGTRLSFTRAAVRGNNCAT